MEYSDLGYVIGFAIVGLLFWKFEFNRVQRTFDVIIGIVSCFTIYFLPIGIAILRNRENKAMIFFINLFGGLFIIGWFIAFFMSLKARNPDYDL